MERLEEARLIELAADGDRDAADRLIRTHQRSLYAYLLRMCGRPDVAEDVTQEAFVRVLSNLNRFDPRFRFSTWLFTIGRRLYMNQAAKMRPVYDSDTVGAWRGDGEAPEDYATGVDERSQQRSEIDEALDRLTVEQREVLVLFHQQDWPINLISRQLGMPEGTVKSHLHRGRARLRAALKSVRAKRDLQRLKQRSAYSATEVVGGRG